MCNQAVGLIAAEIERRGIPTACIVLLKRIAESVRPPRSLFVPFRLGYALGSPHDAAGQRAVLLAALRLIGREGTPPLLESWDADRPD